MKTCVFEWTSSNGFSYSYTFLMQIYKSCDSIISQNLFNWESMDEIFVTLQTEFLLTCGIRPLTIHPRCVFWIIVPNWFKWIYPIERIFQNNSLPINESIFPGFADGGFGQFDVFGDVQIRIEWHWWQVICFLVVIFWLIPDTGMLIFELIILANDTRVL